MDVAYQEDQFLFGNSMLQEQWEVKWWKWPCTTWEPREHLQGCTELVTRYEAALHATVKSAPFEGVCLHHVSLEYDAPCCTRNMLHYACTCDSTLVLTHAL